MRFLLIVVLTACLMVACGSPPGPEGPEEALIAKGRDLFFNETFGGNGRTCGSCHPEENNFTIDPAFISTLPDDDPLFVAEFNPDLMRNFENPRLMREFGLIVENLDGFGDLENVFTMRGVPHTLGLSLSIESRDGPQTGWSGDGAPGDRTLRSFATGAVIQHFTKTLSRVAGVDFRLPTAKELDALEAFQLSLGRQEELTLPLPLTDVRAARGQEIFNDPAVGKCSNCHFNAGANASPALGANAGNLNFNTGVEDLPDEPAVGTGEKVPTDDGRGIPGDGTFNTPSLVEAPDTPPFFHNNAVLTLEGAVAFYSGDAFNNSPAGQLLEQATGSGINLDATQIEAVAAFLRVINTLDNIRQSIEFTQLSIENWFFNDTKANRLLAQATNETGDALLVLTEGGLHGEAVAHLQNAGTLLRKAINSPFLLQLRAEKAIRELELAREELVDSRIQTTQR